MRKNHTIATLFLVTSLCLAGCSGITRAEVSRAAKAAREAENDRVALTCLNYWINNLTSQETIEAGLTELNDQTGDPAITHDPTTNTYSAHPETGNAFDAWAGDNGVPWSKILGSILNGDGCPYTNIPGISPSPQAPR